MVSKAEGPGAGTAESVWTPTAVWFVPETYTGMYVASGDEAQTTDPFAGRLEQSGLMVGLKFKNEAYETL